MTNKPVAQFHERFKEAMRIRQMRQQDVSNLTYISRANISHYASGERVPKSDNLYQIAKALNVNETWLLGYDVDMERNHVGTNDYLITNGTEQLLIEKFRDADDHMKDLVIMMLTYADKIKKGYDLNTNAKR